jgi:hypothetical protein
MAEPRATRHSRDLIVQIGKAQAAIEKTLKTARTAPATATVSERAARHSRDLVAKLNAAAAALAKAHELAIKETESASPRASRHSRDLRPKRT